MSINRVQLKREAKGVIREARPRPLWVALLYIVILLALTVLSLAINGTWEAYSEMIDAAAQGELVYPEATGSGSFLGWLLSLALDIMTIEMTVGFSIYCLRIWRRTKAGAGDLFDSFGVFFRSILIRVIPSILLSLWSLIYVLAVTGLTVLAAAISGSVELALWVPLAGLPFLIPMIVASFAYSQSVYIMLDNPQMSCLQCVLMSRRIMKGHKWEMFVLELSFIGWGILCVIPVVYLWVMPYMSVTFAGYYDRVMADFISRSAPPVQPQPPEA